MRYYKILVVSSFFLIVFFISGCIVVDNKSDDIHLKSSLEEVSADNKFLTDDSSSYKFNGGDMRSSVKKRSGNFSVVTYPERTFALGIDLKNIQKDSYVEASVWCNGVGGKIVVSSDEPELWKPSSEIADSDGQGWNKFLLSIFIVPTVESQDLKVYVWNSGSDTVYFDDIEIKVLKKKVYPEYSADPLHVVVDSADFIKLNNTRLRAFKSGILQTEDDDWVKAFMFEQGELMKAKMRLKGDWLDHLNGYKWSFRVKLKKKKAWNRMRVFSLQNPAARYGVNEWFLHKFLISEGLLTTRYGFIPLSVNKNNMGLYAWEEHFTKQLLESQKYLEGPILHFNESALWDGRVLNAKGEPNNKSTAIFRAANIKPFETSRTLSDSVKRKQFLIAQELLYQYKFSQKSTSQIFNIKSLAKYFASMDVFLFMHSLHWHNQRFYYNPVLCKLEPIAYDCYSDLGLEIQKDNPIFGYINKEKYQGRDILMTTNLFNDSSFLKYYINYLERYSSVNFIDSVFGNYSESTQLYDSMINMEFPTLHFKKNEILESASRISKLLPEFEESVKKRNKRNEIWHHKLNDNTKYDTVLEDFFAPNLLICYQQSVNVDSIEYLVESYFPEELMLLGVGKNKKKFDTVIFPLKKTPKYCNGKTNPILFKTSFSNASYLFFSRKSNNNILVAEINKWPLPTGKQSPCQELLAQSNLTANEVVEKVVDKTVFLHSGSVTISSPLIIPPNHRLIIPAGTEINLIDSAMIISYSPVFINGTKDKPVIIKSSDFSANGFTVLQAQGRSKLQNVRFENMNTLDYKGWTLTGSVTFYESDVDLDNVGFYRNQCEDALNIKRSDFYIKNSSFDYIFADAFDSDFCTGTVDNLEFTNIGNDAIDFSGSEITILNTHISGAQDKGISGGEDSHLTVKNCFIENANIGIASKDLSVVDVSDTKIVDCNYGLVLLQKKPEYGPAKIHLDKVKLLNSKTKMLIEEGSEVYEHGVLIKGKEKDVAKKFY